MNVFRSALFAATSIATAFAFSPAAAGGYWHSGPRVHANIHYAGGYHVRPYRGYYGPRRHFRRGRHFRRHRGGGDAALIALGAIGGAIILNEIIEDDRRRDDRIDRRHRSYNPRFDDYYYRRGEEYRYDPDIDQAIDEGRGRIDRQSAPDAQPARPVERDQLDEELLGGEEALAPSRAVEARVPVDRAYRACAAEARDAASRDGQFIAMPAEPTDIDVISDDYVRITADLTAQDQRGRQFLRTLTCEADLERITFLQLS